MGTSMGSGDDLGSGDQLMGKFIFWKFSNYQQSPNRDIHYLKILVIVTPSSPTISRYIKVKII